jgi:hypothetical protein
MERTGVIIPKTRRYSGRLRRNSIADTMIGSAGTWCGQGFSGKSASCRAVAPPYSSEGSDGREPMRSLAFIIIAGVFMGALVLDLRATHAPLSRRAAVARAGAWAGLAVACGVLLEFMRGGHAALAFASAYISELALSFDNVAASCGVGGP